MDRELLDHVESQRREIEEHVNKLKKGLRYWQDLELDYEAIKDEILPLDEQASPGQCIEAAKLAGAERVDEKELKSLVGASKGSYRKPSQIIDTLDKRIEYVSRNVATLRKQVTDADRKRNALLLAEQPEHIEEAGLPLTEITEELDERGNVISTKLERPAERVSNISDALKDAGVDVPEIAPSTSKVEELPDDASDSVEEVEPGDDEAANLATMLNDRYNFNESTKMLEPKPTMATKSSVNTSTSASTSLVPGDTAEEAALRQEMLQYGREEVGNIVAELDMAEGDTTDADDSDMFDEDDYEVSDDDEEESEDEFGKAKRPTISKKYQKQMEQLKKSLGMEDITNLGPTPDLPPEICERLDKPPAAEAAKKAAIARAEAANEALKSEESEAANKKPKSAKKVAFANDLDIADEKPHVKNGAKVAQKSSILQENITERATMSTMQDKATKPVGKISKFKAGRASAQASLFPPPMEQSLPIRENPSGPADRTLADQLIERPDPGTATAPDPDDFDEELHRKQVALEYHAAKNKRIHEQGGYVDGGEFENWGDEYSTPYVEDPITGEQKKISRFKAARMRG